MTCTTLADVITDALKSPTFAMPHDTAKTLAEQILRSAAERGHSGSEYYLPSMNHMTREERNASIRKEFIGCNLSEVCRKYGVGKTTVYRACKRGE